MENEGQGCAVCSSSQKQLLCHQCVNDKRLADVRRFRQQMALKRSLLLDKLEQRLKPKVRSRTSCARLLPKVVFAYSAVPSCALQYTESRQQLQLDERMKKLQVAAGRAAATIEQLAQGQSHEIR